MKQVKLKIKNLTIDCTDAERACDFYAELMGWEKISGFDYPALKTENGLIILFTVPDIPYVPPIWPEESDKQQKQMHLDLTVDDLSSAITKAIELGAVKAAAQYGGEHVITMLDTEGHPFCLGERSETKSEFDLYYERNGYGAIPDISINIDCKAQKMLRDFYIELTGWDSEFHSAALIADNGMIVCFQGCDVDATMHEYIPPVYPEQSGKQQKQMQFTFQTDNIQSETLLDFDIAGHPFCISGMDYVYHGSPIGGLTYIEPKISTHGKSWVYATNDKGIALVFLQKWNDYLINQSINNGHQELTERLPNVFEEIYKGKGGYLYYLDSKNFLEGRTSFSAEVVSEKREQVIKCEIIDDCYEKLCEMEKNNEITLFRYPNRPNYIPSDDSDLIKKTKKFFENSQDKKGIVNYAIKMHPKLKDDLLALLKEE